MEDEKGKLKGKKKKSFAAELISLRWCGPLEAIRPYEWVPSLVSTMVVW